MEFEGLFLWQFTVPTWQTEGGGNGGRENVFHFRIRISGPELFA